MKIGKIIGKVWAEHKVPELKGCLLHIVQPVSREGQNVGHPLVVADPLHLAGSGDTVVYVTNTDATQAFDKKVAPVNASLVALIDSID